MPTEAGWAFSTKALTSVPRMQKELGCELDAQWLVSLQCLLLLS